MKVDTGPNGSDSTETIQSYSLGGAHLYTLNTQAHVYEILSSPKQHCISNSQYRFSRFAGLTQTCNQRIDRQTDRLHYVATCVGIVNNLHLPLSLRNFCSVGDVGKVATGSGSLLAVAITARQIAL